MHGLVCQEWPAVVCQSCDLIVLHVSELKSVGVCFKVNCGAACSASYIFQWTKWEQSIPACRQNCSVIKPEKCLFFAHINFTLSWLLFQSFLYKFKTKNFEGIKYEIASIFCSIYCKYMVSVMLLSRAILKTLFS